MINLQELTLEQIEALKTQIAKAEKSKILDTLEHKTLISTNSNITKYEKILDKISDNITKKVEYNIKYKTGSISLFRYCKGYSVFYYPSCGLSEYIAEKLGTKTLSFDTVCFLARLGYIISLTNESKTEAQKERNAKYLEAIYSKAQEITL